jgi:RNA polymerase sigma-70 factor, ECF subfamily
MGKSFEILTAEYRPMVVTYLSAVLGDEHLAEDLTQETFLAAHRSIETFDEGRNFGAWLRGIARHKALQDRRAAARHPMLVDSCVVEGMEQVYTLFDESTGPWEGRVTRVRWCVGQLSDQLKQAVVAVYGRGQTIRQAADDMGASFSAVAKRLSRARDLVRQCVERSLPRETPSQEMTEAEHVRAE